MLAKVRCRIGDKIPYYYALHKKQEEYLSLKYFKYRRLFVADEM